MILIKTFAINILIITLLFFNPVLGNVFAEKYFCKYGESVDLEYELDNGKVKAICLDEGALAIEVFFETKGEGRLTLTIPRDVLDIRNPDCSDKKYIVSGDLDDPKFNETKTTNHSRTLEIHYSDQDVKEYLAITTDTMIMKPYKLGSECFPMDTKNIPPPIKQVNNGVPVNEVICKEGLELIFKSTNGSPACVKPTTAMKLIERGWGV